MAESQVPAIGSCPFCGAPLLFAGQNNCASCGRLLPTVEQAAEASSAAAAGAVPSMTPPAPPPAWMPPAPPAAPA